MGAGHILVQKQSDKNTEYHDHHDDFSFHTLPSASLPDWGQALHIHILTVAETVQELPEPNLNPPRPCLNLDGFSGNNNHEYTIKWV